MIYAPTYTGSWLNWRQEPGDRITPRRVGAIPHTLIRFRQLPDNLKGIVYLMLASVAFSLVALLIKLLGQRLHVTQILFLRQIGMSLMVLPTIVRRFPGSLRSNRPGLQVTRIALALAAMLGGFSAIIHMPLADATAIFFAKSFFVTIFAVLILGETVGGYRWSAVAIGFAGVMIMLQPGTANFSIYGLAALTGSAAAGAVMVILRVLTRIDSTDTIMTWSAIGVGLLMAFPGIYYWQWPDSGEWILIGCLAIASFFGQRGNILAYKHGEASLLASLDYTRLLWATLFGYLVFAQVPGSATWLGASIVVAAAVFMIYREAHLRGKSPMTPSPETRQTIPPTP